MVTHLIRRILFAALLLTGLVLTSAVPAFAQPPNGFDATCFGGNSTVRAGETVQDVFGLGCNYTIEAGATVQRNVSIFGGNLTNSGQVNGSIAVFGGNITIESTAVVNGNVAALGGNVSVVPGATVRGQVGGRPGNPGPVISETFGLNRLFRLGFDFFGVVVTALAFAALGALVVIFVPEPTRRVSEAVQSRPWGTVGVGCLTMIVLPILAILLVITVIGVPVAFLLGLAAVAAWVFGWIAVGYLAGERILQAFRTRDILPVVAAVVGILVLMLLTQIPVLGWLLGCLIGLFGVGAVVLTRFGTRAYPAIPGMMLTPAPAPVPGGFTPTARDVSALEERARQAAPAEAPPAAAPDAGAPAPPTEPPTNPT